MTGGREVIVRFIPVILAGLVDNADSSRHDVPLASRISRANPEKPQELKASWACFQDAKNRITR
jgi:hypothetical protein